MPEPKKTDHRNRQGGPCRLALEALETRTMLAADMLAGGQLTPDGHDFRAEVQAHEESPAAARPMPMAVQAVRSLNLDSYAAFLPPAAMLGTDLHVNPGPMGQQRMGMPARTAEGEPAPPTPTSPALAPWAERMLGRGRSGDASQSRLDLPRDELLVSVQITLPPVEPRGGGLATRWSPTAGEGDVLSPPTQPQMTNRPADRPQATPAATFSPGPNGGMSRWSSALSDLYQPAAAILAINDPIEGQNANVVVCTPGETGLADHRFPRIGSTVPSLSQDRGMWDRSDFWAPQIVGPLDSLTRSDGIEEEPDLDDGLIDIGGGPAADTSARDESDGQRGANEEDQRQQTKHTVWLDATWQELTRAHAHSDSRLERLKAAHRGADPTASDTRRGEADRDEGGLIELLASDSPHHGAWSGPVVTVKGLEQVQLDGGLGLFQEIEVATDVPLPADDVAERDVADNDSQDTRSSDVQAAANAQGPPSSAAAAPFAFIVAAVAFAAGRRSKEQRDLDRSQWSEYVLSSIPEIPRSL